MNLILAIEIGRNSSKVALINQYGNIQAKFFVENNFEKGLLENLYQKIVEGLETVGINYEEVVDKIGISTAGYVDHMLGIVRYSAGLDWNNYYLKDKAEELFNKPILVLNDANAAALGEFWTGAAKQYDSIVFYTLDNGIGGALILEGKLMSGARGFSGEFGHGGGIYQTKYDCVCGLKGCIEPMSSGVGIARYFADKFKENPGHPAETYFKDLETYKTKDIISIYEENGHPVEILDILTEALEPLIMHMATMINGLDPEAIIISGGLSNMGQLLIDIITQNIKKYIIEKFAEDITIEIAELGNDAGIIGAAYYALNDWKIF
ncbi:ROK family protein [Spiroplasma culicicola]|uniref:Glucokinase n=1 Tax=Spiroplasma culicicola AES-1 TaxID=1276246 RepID=W6AGR9_9MOLU|nr:ROK family protein [Spiroplasma culicicola]AHI52884.1 glucokinase [Spiroplasma culicicola AES-1]